MTEPHATTVQKLWDQAPHSAFTDLIRHNDQWLCAFREATDHHSLDGCLRLLRAQQPHEWSPEPVITVGGWDLRDPKLCTTPDGRLMLTAGALQQQPDAIVARNLVWFSDDGQAWTAAADFGEPGFWLWRPTWHDDCAFAVGYSLTAGDRGVRLYRSRDGLQFDPVAASMAAPGFPTEASLMFHDTGGAVCLLRRDGEQATALLGTAEPPYNQWHWRDLGVRLGGPQLVARPGNQALVAARFHTPEVHTGLATLDLTTGDWVNSLALPSGGDCSYPGIVVSDGHVWVSYYSSHEGRSNIYLADVTW